MLVRDVAAALSAQLVGDGSLSIERIVHPAAAVNPSDLAVAMTTETFSALANSKAQAAVISDQTTPPHDRFKAIILAAPERGSLARLTALFDDGPAHGAGIHPSAIVAPDARIGEGVSIGPLATIGPRSRIGAHSVILPSVTIGADVAIGAHALIYSGVRIGDRVTIGERVIIQSNAVIGSDGFSFLPAASEGQMPVRVHSLGDVIIGNDVEIGASTTIDRATLTATRIGDGTKIDNQVQIAHNVTIGNGCLICGMVGISGSVEIGDRVILGGGAGVADHVRIGAGAMIAAGAGIATNVSAGARMSGHPAMPHERTTGAFAFLMRHQRVTRDLESAKTRLDALEKRGQEKSPGAE